MRGLQNASPEERLAEAFRVPLDAARGLYERHCADLEPDLANHLVDLMVYDLAPRPDGCDGWDFDLICHASAAELVEIKNQCFELPDEEYKLIKQEMLACLRERLQHAHQPLPSPHKRPRDNDEPLSEPELSDSDGSELSDSDGSELSDSDGSDNGSECEYTQLSFAHGFAELSEALEPADMHAVMCTQGICTESSLGAHATSSQHSASAVPLTGPAVVQTSSSVRELLLEQVSECSRYATMEPPQQGEQFPPPGIMHPGGSVAANVVISRAKWPISKMLATLEQVAGSDFDARRELASYDHLDVDRLKREHFGVIVVSPTAMGMTKEELLKQTKTVYKNKLLTAEDLQSHIVVRRPTLVVMEAAHDGSYEIISLFAARTPELEHLWGELQPGRQRALGFVAGMRKYCGTSKRQQKTGSGEMRGVEISICGNENWCI